MFHSTSEAMTFPSAAILARLALMALASHQKAVVELASINSRALDLIERLRKMAPHDDIDAAIAEVEKVRGPLTRAHQRLVSLPASYTPHESKIRTKDITEGAIVAVREAQRKKYAGVLSGEDMACLEVLTVGPTCSVKTRSDVRLLIPRGHLVTSETASAT